MGTAVAEYADPGSNRARGGRARQGHPAWPDRGLADGWRCARAGGTAARPGHRGRAWHREDHAGAKTPMARRVTEPPPTPAARRWCRGC